MRSITQSNDTSSVGRKLPRTASQSRELQSRQMRIHKCQEDRGWCLVGIQASRTTAGGLSSSGTWSSNWNPGFPEDAFPQSLQIRWRHSCLWKPILRSSFLYLSALVMNFVQSTFLYLSFCPSASPPVALILACYPDDATEKEVEWHSRVLACLAMTQRRCLLICCLGRWLTSFRALVLVQLIFPLRSQKYLKNFLRFHLLSPLTF